MIDLLPEITSLVLVFLTPADRMFLEMSCKHFARLNATRSNLNEEYIMDVASHGSLDLCVIAMNRWPDADWYLCAAAISHGHFSLLKSLSRLGCDLNADAAVAVVENDSLSTNQKRKFLKWLRAKRCPWDGRCTMIAASLGDLKLLKWLRENGCDWDYRTCAEAALEGHLGVLKWACGMGCEWDESLIISAVASGHVEIVKYVRENDAFEYDSLVTYAVTARKNQLEMLKYLIETGSSWDPEVCNEALASGHLDVFDWAYGNGCPVNLETAVNAAQFGYMDIFKTILETEHQSFAEENSAWYQEINRAAVRGGQLELLKWFHDAVPFELTLKQCTKLAVEAIRQNHEDILDWLLKFDLEIVDLYVAAIWNNHLHILKKLHYVSPQVDNPAEICLEAIRAGHIRILVWLVGAGYVFDSPYYYQVAASLRDLKVLKFLRSNGCPPSFS